MTSSSRERLSTVGDGIGFGSNASRRTILIRTGAKRSSVRRSLLRADFICARLIQSERSGRLSDGRVLRLREQRAEELPERLVSRRDCSTAAARNRHGSDGGSKDKIITHLDSSVKKFALGKD